VAKAVQETTPLPEGFSLTLDECECGEPRCLKQEADKRTRAMVAARVREEAGAYQIVVYDDTGAARTANVIGPFDDALEEVRRLTADLVSARFELQQDQASQDPQDAVLPLQHPSSKRPGPAAFWGTLATTAALGLTAIVLDSVTYSRSSSLNSQNPTQRRQESWETTRRLQIADRVFLAATAASAAASLVLLLLTDFEAGTRADGKRTAIVPTAQPRGCLVVLTRSF
jgi:hypothetical protein